jgi:sugar lactone lactonase YvrE
LEPQVLIEGLHFGEGPRWRDGQLWFSDMHGDRVLRATAGGNLMPVVEVPAWPSGLGWLPGGDLLVVAMRDQAILRFDGKGLSLHADLSALADFYCNDMVVDAQGRAYVGNFGFDLAAGADPKATALLAAEPDGSVRVVAEDLQFPNGMVITPDEKTLIVAETFGAQLTAFAIEPNGDLTRRRPWATLPQGAVPDGICLDEAGGIWVASPTTNECLRVLEGGAVSHRYGCDRGAFACMLGGDLLYMLTAQSSQPETCRAGTTGQIVTCPAPYRAAGRP